MPQKKIQKPTKCYHCGREIRDSRDLVEKKIPLHTRSGIRMYRRKFHINCIPKYFENLDTESETMQEQSDWIKCYELFRKLLGIKEDAKLPKHAVMRLQGLRIGEYIPNGQNTRALERGYSFDVILNTMRFSSVAITDACKNVSFKDESHKINYCMSIIMSNINFMLKRMESKALTDKLLDSNKEDVVNIVAPYQAKGGMGRVQEALQDIKKSNGESQEYWDSLFN